MNEFFKKIIVDIIHNIINTFSSSPEAYKKTLEVLLNVADMVFGTNFNLDFNLKKINSNKLLEIEEINSHTEIKKAKINSKIQIKNYKKEKEYSILNFKDKYQLEIYSFFTELVNEIFEINVEKLQTPDIALIAKALNDVRFQMENKEIRKMYINLIASSMDLDRNNTFISSFSNIVQQLSPIDAKILHLFENPLDMKPLIKFVHDVYALGPNGEKLKNYPNQYNDCTDYIYFDQTLSDIDTNAISISNLYRLGLIKAIKAPENADGFEVFASSTEILNYREHIMEIYKNKYNIDENIFYIKYRFYLTPLGKSFKEVCLKNEDETPTP